MNASIATMRDVYGLYTVPQATALAEIPNTAKVRRWLFGTTKMKAAIIPFYGAAESELISFIDLVQMMAIRDIRKSRRISLSKVRQAIEVANNRYGIKYPFARKHRTYVFEDDVVIRLDDETIVQITGRYRHEHLIKQVAEFYMQDLGFDADGLANSYTPETDGHRSVVLQPHRRSGAPVVLPCNVTVEALVNAVASEGSEVGAAQAMGVELPDIKIAMRYEQRLLRAAA